MSPRRSGGNIRNWSSIASGDEGFGSKFMKKEVSSNV